MTCPNCADGAPCPACITETVAKSAPKMGRPPKPKGEKLVPLGIRVRSGFHAFMDSKRGKLSQGRWIEEQCGFDPDREASK